MGKHRNVPAPMVAEQSTQGPWAHRRGSLLSCSSWWDLSGQV